MGRGKEGEGMVLCVFCFLLTGVSNWLQDINSRSRTSVLSRLYSAFLSTHNMLSLSLCISVCWLGNTLL